MITEEQFIDFKCPYCSEPVSFPRENAGRVQSCPTCSQAVIVPGDGSELGGKIPVPFSTARLQLRRLAPGDWKSLLEIVSDEELFQYAEWGPLDEEAVLRWLDTDRHTQLTTPEHTFYLGIESQAEQKLIGFAGLTFTDPHQLQASAHLMIGRKWHRQGFALEAAEAVLGFCFEGIRLHRVTAVCDTRNSAALGLCGKLGMRREGEFIKDRKLKGEWVNTATFAALGEEYIAAGDSSNAGTPA